MPIFRAVGSLSFLFHQNPKYINLLVDYHLAYSLVRPILDSIEVVVFKMCRIF